MEYKLLEQPSTPHVKRPSTIDREGNVATAWAIALHTVGTGTDDCKVLQSLLAPYLGTRCIQATSWLAAHYLVSVPILFQPDQRESIYYKIMK